MQVIQVPCVGFRIMFLIKFCFHHLFIFILQSYWFISQTSLRTCICFTHDTDTKPFDSLPHSCNLPYSYSSREIQRCTPDRDTETGPDKISPASWTRHSTVSPKPPPLTELQIQGRFVALKLLTVSTPMYLKSDKKQTDFEIAMRLGIATEWKCAPGCEKVFLTQMLIQQELKCQSLTS